MSLTGFIVKMAAPVPKVEAFERFLFIGPHPDDIEIGAGATVAKLVAKGKKVSFLICTDGRFGDEYAPEGTTASELIQIRKQETLDSAKKLGVTDVRFLEFSDGAMYDINEMEKELAKAIGDINPEILFCPDPDVISECHSDHLNVGRLTKKLAFFAPFKNIMAKYDAKPANVKAIAFYMTAKPNRYVKTKGFLKKQLEVITTCFPSQYPSSNPATSSVVLYLKLRAYEFGLRCLSGTAEGFRVLGTTQMHCLPEAGR